MGGGGDADLEDIEGVGGLLWTSRVSVIRILSSCIEGDGVRSRRSTIRSRIRTGDGLRSRTGILSLVSITRARSRSGGESDRSRSTSLVLTLSTAGISGDLSLSTLSTTLSRYLIGLGDLGLLSSGREKVSVSRSRNTMGPASLSSRLSRNSGRRPGSRSCRIYVLTSSYSRSLSRVRTGVAVRTSSRISL
jgi:hypothetical protein